MLNVKEAVDRAANQLTWLFQSATNVKLEELELSEDEQYWLITLSYDEEDSVGIKNRKYKTFKVKSETGDVVAMKIRTVH